ncbi:glycoside hydrolase superfamily, partial [Phaeosphaeriaceae sp. PMI808]
ISFLVAANNTNNDSEINLANQLAGCNETKHPYICPNVGGNITACRGKNTTALLSVGGQNAATEQGWPSAEAVKKGAKIIWEMFGPYTNKSSERPFGETVVNGFGINLETVADPQKNFIDFSKELHSFMSRANTTDTKYYFTASPQCPLFPNQEETMAIINATDGVFDKFNVQFYNNPGCEFSKNK